ncbi:MAG: iron ABC transporter permease [Candidatus Schekmanbacteria bacterium]|nr:iron ABC transporter permease [Candidatus Schekmanbacteria bacterium]
MRRQRIVALTRRRLAVTTATLALAAALSAAAGILLGPVHIDWRAALADPAGIDATIVFETRLPRVVMGLLAGSGLSVAGLAIQALLKNPLAEPFTLGISSGASLGAILAIRFGLDLEIAGIGALPLLSFLASLATVGIVYALARQGTALPVSTLLLAGVTLSFFFGAVILFIHYLSDYGQSYRFVRWMMGAIDVAGYGPAISAAPLLVLGVLMLFSLARPLNLLAAGDLFAASRGVDVLAAQRWVFVGASLITGAIISVCGPIGFVGLIVPHVTRLLFGSDHRLLLPAAALIGAAFLVLCDAVARIAVPPLEIPVGVVTAMLGGPYFLFLLRKARARVLFGGF